jgi:integrase
MTIKKIDNGIYFIRVRARIDGKIISKEAKKACKLEEAKKLEIEFQYELSQQKTTTKTEGTFKTFGEVIDYYLKYSNAKLDKFQFLFKNLKNSLGGIRINELSDSFEKFLYNIKHNHSEHTGKPLSINTVSHYIRYSKIACNFAFNRDKIHKNPLTIFHLLPDDPRERVLSDNERLTLLNILREKGSYLYWATYFSLTNPIRIEDLFRLKRQNLDMIKPWVHFYPQKTSRKKPRETCLPFLDKELKNYFISILPANSPYLFPKLKDSKIISDRMTRYGIRTHWHSMLEEAGIKDFRWHDLKHCAITSLLDNGYTERDLMNLGIQYDQKMINRYYKKDANKVLEKFKMNGETISGQQSSNNTISMRLS